MSRLRDGRPRPGGPPLKLTDEIHDKIVEVVASGCVMETAAAYAGINAWTFKTWLRNGRDGLKEGRNNRYTRLVAAIEEARANAEVGRVARVAKAGINGEWQADAWWLERTFPDRYGRRLRHEGTVQLQAVPLVDWSKYTLEQAEMLVELLRIGMPDSDDPALSQSARPALELLAGPRTDPDAVEAAE